MQTAKLGEVLNDTFLMTTKRGEPVKGLLDKDFQRSLFEPDGAELSEQIPVTISELGNGMYRLNFRPSKAGHWAVTISHEEHCPWGLSETYQVEEAEAALKEEEEAGNPTPYVILRHWPDSPTPDLMEHWDIKLKNPQGAMYEWSSMEDPFETAYGILGETIDCCSGEKALEIEGEIELKPGSPWNQSKVPAHLGLIQSGQVHFVTEEPGLVIAYLDQLPFRAVQEGDSDEWDITLGVWAAMSKKRYAEMIAMPVKDYNTSELGEQVLLDDFRIAMSWHSTTKAGMEVDKTENEIRAYLEKIVQEIGDRGQATFNLSQMRETSRYLLADTLWDLYGKKGIYEPQPHAQMIADGSKKMKLEQKPWDLAGFYGLIDGENVIGMVRFEDREEIWEEDFLKRTAEHKLTKEEVHAWGWEWPVYGWRIREYVALDKPRAIDQKAEWSRKGINLMVEDADIYAKLGLRPAFGSPGGKKYLAKLIVSMIPEHKIYVEPFAGGAAVFFEKEPGGKEILNDKNTELANAYRWMKTATPAEIGRMSRRDWIISRGAHAKARKMQPTNKADRFYKFMYLRLCSYGASEKDTVDTGQIGVRRRVMERLPRLKQRLANAAISSSDYKQLLAMHDSQDTFFYLDPPYTGDTTDKFDSDVNLEELKHQCAGLRGKWLLSLHDNSETRGLFKQFHVRTVEHPRVMDTGGGVGTKDTELLIANYPIRIPSNWQAKLSKYSMGDLTTKNSVIYAELRTLVEHTKDELERAGLFDEDSDYGGMLADSVLAIMKVFAKQGHSGFSAAMCRELFQRLSNFETLTPITSDPEEWQDVSEIAGGEKGQMWQNKRNPAVFSVDDGKTWYNVETNTKDGFETSTDNDHWHIWFPGHPRTSGQNGHDHATDENEKLALEAHGHMHDLLEESA